MSRRSLIAIPLAVAATAAAAVALPALGGAQSGAEEVITVQERVLRINVADVPPRARGERGPVSQGDRITTVQSLHDAGGARVGTLTTDCVAMGRPAPIFRVQLQCQVVYRLGADQLTAAGVFRLSPGARLAITGGTGRFTGARGVVESVAPARGFDSADTIRITA